MSSSFSGSLGSILAFAIHDSSLTGSIRPSGVNGVKLFFSVTAAAAKEAQVLVFLDYHKVC